ncbi:MAG: hypothetical protein WBP67_09440 [Thermoanaerobaculia bacterium]
MWKNFVQTALTITLLGAATTPSLSQATRESAAQSVPSGTVVDNAGKVGSHVAIVSGDDGLSLVAYFDETLGDLKVAKCVEPSCSEGVSIATVDSEDRVGSYAAMAIDREGLPVLSYFDATAGDLKVARCSTPDCSGEATISRLDTEGIVGLYTSIAIGQDDLPVISYLDRDNCNLKVAKCNDPACVGGDEVVSTVDKKDCVGLFSSIAISTDGTPLISYYDSNQGRLKVAKCKDSACTGGKAKISVVDESVSAGSFAGVAIGADDLPVISYYNHSHGDLRVAHCNDPACAGGDESITTLDTDGLVGSFAALGIGDDGLPVVAYYDLIGGFVKLIRCQDQACAEFETPRVVAQDEETMKSFLAMAIRPDGTPVVAFFNQTNGDLKLVSVPLESDLP